MAEMGLVRIEMALLKKLKILSARTGKSMTDLVSDEVRRMLTRKKWSRGGK